MLRILSTLVAVALVTTGASAQVKQSGNVTAKHVACWTTTGVIQDCGTAAIPFASSLGTVGQGPTICANSAAVTGPYARLCLSANTASAGIISLDALGGASAQDLQLCNNGSCFTVPVAVGGTLITGTPPFNVNGVPAFSTTGGTIVDSGIRASSGVITSGTWLGQAITVTSGGTGATSASGARTSLGLGTMATQNASGVTISGGTITGMPVPSLASDVANKQYVDGVASGLIPLAQSNYATAAALPNTPTYANGTLGVGATLTAGSNAALVVDSITVSSSNVILVKNQAAPAQNGIYTVTTVGDGSTPWVLTRATYFDQAAEMLIGSATFVTSGATNSGKTYVLAATVTTVGTTAANFNLFAQSQSIPGIVAVDNFGAKADGSDDSAAIQAAIASFGTSGGTVCLTNSKVYSIASTIPLGNGSTIGASTVNGIVLDACGGAGGNAVTAGPYLSWIGANHGIMVQINGPSNGIGIKNISFQANGLADTAIKNVQGAYGVFENVTIGNWQGTAIVNTTQCPSTTNVGNLNSWNLISLLGPALSTSSGMSLDGCASGSFQPDTTGSIFNQMFLGYGGATGSYGLQIGYADSNTFNLVGLEVSFGATGGCDVKWVQSANTAFPYANNFYSTGATPNGWCGTLGTNGNKVTDFSTVSGSAFPSLNYLSGNDLQGVQYINGAPVGLPMYFAGFGIGMQPASSTLYYGLIATGTGTEGLANQIAPRTGTAASLCVHTDVSPSVTPGFVFTLRKNGVNTALTITTSGGSNTGGCDTNQSHGVAVTQGVDVLDLQVVSPGGATTINTVSGSVMIH